MECELCLSTKGDKFFMCKKCFEKLQAERDRYMEALEFYATDKHWAGYWDENKWVNGTDEVYNDCGKKAKQALDSKGGE